MQARYNAAAIMSFFFRLISQLHQVEGFADVCVWEWGCNAN